MKTYINKPNYMSTDNIDNLFKRLRELKDEKEFHINEEIVEYLLHKKLSKLNK